MASIGPPSPYTILWRYLKKSRIVGYKISKSAEGIVRVKEVMVNLVKLKSVVGYKNNHQWG